MEGCTPEPSGPVASESRVDTGGAPLLLSVTLSQFNKKNYQKSYTVVPLFAEVAEKTPIIRT